MLTFFLFMICEQKNFTPNDFPMKLKWDDNNQFIPSDHVLSYRLVQLKHLTKVMFKWCTQYFKGKRQKELDLKDVLGHPFFMTVPQLIDIEDRLQTFYSSKEMLKLNVH